jgi:HlyD family secretion protein
MSAADDIGSVRATVPHDGAADSIAAPAAATDALVRVAPGSAGTSVPSRRPALTPRNHRFPLTLKRSLVAGALLILAGLVGFYFFRPPTVTVGTVMSRDVAPAIQGVGNVEAKVVVNVSSKVTGRVVAVLVDQGDTIKAGQTLVRLDAAQSAADVDRGEANVRAAEAQLRDLLAGPRQQEIEQLRARLASVSATRTLAEHDLQRSQELFAKQLISAQDLDRARQVYDVATAAERDARHGLDLALENWARKDQIDAARAQLLAAQSALVLSRANLAETVIVSPLDGYVVSRELEVGGIVNPGIPIFKIADPRTAWATVYVDARDTAGLAIGDPADITFRSLPGRALQGRVARIQREGDRVTEQLAIDVAFIERPSRLILGEQVEAIIRPPARHGVSALPLAAVVRRPDGPGALVVKNGHIHFTAARLGTIDPAGWVEILDGLHPGDDVVLAPGPLADPSNDGRRVRITPAGVSP